MALFSVAVQGTLIPTVARKLDLIDDEESVLKTFNDYKEDKSTKLVEFTISNNNPMANKSIMDANIPEDILVVMVKRKGDVFVPHGSTVILPGDTLVLSGNNLMNFSDYKEGKSTNLMEIYVNDKSNIVNKSIKDSNIAYDILIVMIKRKDKVIIPNGNTVIMPEDILVVTANDLKNVENMVIAWKITNKYYSLKINIKLLKRVRVKFSYSFLFILKLIYLNPGENFMKIKFIWRKLFL